MRSGGALVHAGAVVAHLLRERSGPALHDVDALVGLACAIVTVQREARVRRLRHRDLRGRLAFLLASSLTLVLTGILPRLLLIAGPEAHAAIDNVLQNRQEVAVVVD